MKEQFQLSKPNLKLAAGRINGNKQLATELMQMFAKDLSQNWELIKQAYEQKNLKLFKELIHKFLGSVLYSGSNELEQHFIKLHHSLYMTDCFDENIKKLIAEGTLLVNQYESFRI